MPPVRRRPALDALVLTLAGLLLAGMTPVAAQDRPGAVLVRHEFTASADGWRITSDAGDIDATLHATGGHPDGYIASDDEQLGETWYFLAPRAVVEQLARAEGGTISFSLKVSAVDFGPADPDVFIVAPAGRLTYHFPAPPGPDWTNYTIALSPDAGWIWNGRSPATVEQMRTVLGNARRLSIRGEFRTGPDEGSLDTFTLRAAPAP